MACIGWPIRKCPGVSAFKSCGSDEAGVIGREFKIPSTRVIRCMKFFILYQNLLADYSFEVKFYTFIPASQIPSAKWSAVDRLKCHVQNRCEVRRFWTSASRNNVFEIGVQHRRSWYRRNQNKDKTECCVVRRNGPNAARKASVGTRVRHNLEMNRLHSHTNE